MIENTNASKNPSGISMADIKKYIGVASVNILAINPNNEKLRKFGWSIPEDADEPQYVTTTERNGVMVDSARVRFLVQIQDLEDKPVIALDFWCGPDVVCNKDKSKYQIIDQFCRTAWGTADEIKHRKIPSYKDGPARIGTPYKLCHRGEEKLTMFLAKYLNITPLQVFDPSKKAYVPSKNPGRISFDDWDAICKANIKELAEAIAMEPDNRVKVILGVRTTEDNKTYQTFLDTGYLYNGVSPDINSGEYKRARSLIDEYFENKNDSPYSFSAEPVKEWNPTVTNVSDNSGNIFDGIQTIAEDDDLPFN